MRSFIILTLILTLIPSWAVAQKYKVDFNLDVIQTTIVLDDRTIEIEVDDTERSVKVDLEKRYVWYRSNMLMSTKGGYDGALLNGSYLERDKEKHLLVQGQYRYGLQDGLWKYWHTNGELQKIEHWHKGEKHGEELSFNDKGTLLKKAYYKNNVLHGLYKQFNENGDLVEDKTMKHGEELIKKQKKEPRSEEKKAKKTKVDKKKKTEKEEEKKGFFKKKEKQEKEKPIKQQKEPGSNKHKKPKSKE